MLGSYFCREIINKEIIYLIDFGSVSTYDYPVYEIRGNNKFILEFQNYKKEKINAILSTPHYLDRTVLNGYRSTRKTELISLIYLIIYIFKGKL